MNDFLAISVVVLVLAIIRGIRTTIRIWERYQLDPLVPRSRILKMLRNIVTFIVASAIYLATLTILGLAGYGPYEAARYFNVVLLVAILGGIPEYVNRTLTKVENEAARDLELVQRSKDR